MVVIMLTKWERKILLDKLHGLDVDPNHLRVVKYRVKRRLEKAFRDMQLIASVFPELMRGVGFEPTNPYGTGALIHFSWILSPAPLTRLGYPRSPILCLAMGFDKPYSRLIRVPTLSPMMALLTFSGSIPFR